MTIRLAELLGSLSLASDMASAFPDGKVLRTALLAAELTQRAGYESGLVQQAYYVTLVRYLGCTGFAHEEAHRYGAGDDVAARHTMVLADAANPIGTLGKIVAGIGRHGNPFARAVAIARLIGDGRAMAEHARAQCDASLHIARSFGMSAPITAAICDISERWDGAGQPGGRKGDEIALAVRALHVADILEIMLARQGRIAARDELHRRAGGHLDPTLARLAAQDVDDLSRLAEEGDLWERFLEAEPLPHIVAPAEAIDDSIRAAGRFSDLKSVFTLGHTSGVADTAAALASRLGLPAKDVHSLRRAAWLHDIGRVGIPNRVWDKPGPLSKLDREQVESHPLATERILRRSPFLQQLSLLASAAHERLDGSGYHRRLSGAAIDSLARVLAVADVSQALVEDRAYRPAHSVEASRRILREEARAGRLDRSMVEAMLDGGRTERPIAPASDLSERETEVLLWVARGKTNPEIGILLGISPKTVQHHVAHIYEKIGVSSRAGAALYAMERGLLNVR